MVCLRAVDPSAFGVTPSLIGHDLHRLPLFQDQSLFAMLERHPRKHLTIRALRPEDRKATWVALDHRGLSAEAIFEAMTRGRLWVNLHRLDAYEIEVRELLYELYDGLQDRVPAFAPQELTASLSLVSPAIQRNFLPATYCHMRWQLRGEQRVYAERRGDQSSTHAVHSGVVNADQRPADLRATSTSAVAARLLSLKSGHAASCPRGTSHRVVSGESLSVELVTTHYTSEAYRLENLARANRFLRQHCGVKSPSTQAQGMVAAAKMTLGSVLKTFGGETPPPRVYYAGRVDPSAPTGWR